MSGQQSPGARQRARDGLARAPAWSSAVVVLGAGGTGLFMAHCLAGAPGFECAGFLDDDRRKQKAGFGGWPVLGGLAAWSRLNSRLLFLSSLYGAKRMQDFAARVDSLKIPARRWASFIDPRATVFPGVAVGKGTFVGPGSVVEPAVRLGVRCALLGNVYVAHDSQLGEYVACANSVSIAGEVRIGRNSFIGANATVREHLQIGANAVVGMGAVVVEPVASGMTVAGNPAHSL
jgi:sugar O-acyltransferase (sialic acid O-acetyltransferase NeuD family)